MQDENSKVERSFVKLKKISRKSEIFDLLKKDLINEKLNNLKMCFATFFQHSSIFHMKIHLKLFRKSKEDKFLFLKNLFNLETITSRKRNRIQNFFCFENSSYNPIFLDFIKKVQSLAKIISEDFSRKDFDSICFSKETENYTADLSKYLNDWEYYFSKMLIFIVENLSFKKIFDFVSFESHFKTLEEEFVINSIAYFYLFFSKKTNFNENVDLKEDFELCKLYFKTPVSLKINKFTRLLKDCLNFHAKEFDSSFESLISEIFEVIYESEILK